MAVVSDAQRMAQLNALASGGTAGLDAYRKAQSDITGYRNQALNNALGAQSGVGSSGFNFGFANKDAADALGSYINQTTQPLADSATSAVSAANAQVGYDKSAIDSYLAQRQAQLGENAREFNTTYQRQLAQAQQQQALYGDLAGLSDSERKAVIEGTGRNMQVQHVNDLQSTADQQSAKEQNVGQGRNRLRYEQAQEDLADNNAQAANAQQQAAAAQAVTPSITNPHPDQTAYARMLAEQAAGNVGRHSLQGLYADQQAQQSLIDNYLSGYRDQQYGSMVDLPQFERQAAEKYGMNPVLAAGLYPSDTSDLLTRRRALDSYLNYDQDYQRAQDRNARSDYKGALQDQIDQIAQDANMDPSEVSAIQKGANLSLEDTAKVLKGDAWAQSHEAAATALASGSADAWVQFRDSVANADGWNDAEKRAIINYWQPVFSQNGYTNNPNNPYRSPNGQ